MIMFAKPNTNTIWLIQNKKSKLLCPAISIEIDWIDKHYTIVVIHLSTKPDIYIN